MEKPMIGIRQADGSFYEIMGDAQTGRKRLVLSAARTDQRGVRIELYRSEDGSLETAAPLGSIALDDTEGLGYQDIEFVMKVDDEGQLDASAALPGQPPRTLTVDLTPFRHTRSDSDLLSDDALGAGELDTLDDSFSLDPEPMTLDLPDLDDFPPLDEPAPRSDADLLDDEALASADLDDLGDFGDFEPEPQEPLAEASSPRPGLPPADPEPEPFDLGDLDAGFGADEPTEPPANENDVPPAEEWEKISLDDMESMEFLDTGDEISAPRAKAPQATAATDGDDLRFDDEEPLHLDDLDSDFGDLPGLGDEPRPSLDDLDHDFLAPPALTAPVEEEPAEAGKGPKGPKAEKRPKAPRPSQALPEVKWSGTLDKTALFLSLATLSLLVLLILVLLFLNMIKAPQASSVQPEVMRWKPVATGVSEPPRGEVVIDLGSGAPRFEAGSVLEVPQALRTAKISLRLEPGDTVADAERRFGPPARSQGILLLW